MMNTFLYSVLCFTLLGSLAGWSLAYANKKFCFKTDSLVEKVRKLLPGANCGACGYSSCDAFAEAVVQKKASIHGCVVGKERVAQAIAEVLSNK
ncbi:hypothetical protein DRO30_03305 [Candidatus Bathyarchaeota archaeon]|nr:MAG: hypothetical protein DRO30_03305 [Candidatus Bathyarchaeota archaeon]